MLDNEPLVLRHRFNPAAQSLVVEHDARLTVNQLRRLVEKAGEADPRPVPSRPERHLPRLAALAAGGALASMGNPLGLAAIGWATTPIARRALKRLRRGKVGVDALDTAAITITLATGQPLTAAVMAGLIEGAELMRDLTAARSRRAIGRLMSHPGATAWVLRGERRVAVPAESLGAGDQVVVGAGDRIPVDGRVISGTMTVDERVMTGESMPVLKTAGAEVFAMTMVADGEAAFEASGSARESRAGRIMTFLESAPIGETRMADHARRIADRFVLPTMGLSAAVYALTGSPSRAASILIFDLATGIRVAAPTTMLAGLLGAARDGILIKGAAALEKLASVDTVVFDKTGTLTAGAPVIQEITCYDGLGPDQLVAVAAAADRGLRHPVANALVAEAERRRLPLPARRRTRSHVGMGVEATLADGVTYLVGNRELLAREGVAVPARSSDSVSEVFVAAGGTCLGVLAIEDVERPEVPTVLNQLRERNVRRICVLSGDTNRATRRLAASLGLDDWTARAAPEDKARFVERLRGDGHVVAVVGDGVNDSMAFAHADLSIAMGHGADLARATADVVLLEDELTLLPRAIDRSRQALGIMNQNVALIAAPNAVGLGGALLAPMNPALAALLNNGGAMVAAANGLRPLVEAPRRPSP